MAIKTKRIPMMNEFMGRNWVEDIRKTCGDNVANKVKLINEISLMYRFIILVPMNLRVIFPKRTIGIWNFQKKSLSLIDEETQRRNYVGSFLLYPIAFTERRILK